jgi:hypothetical protein
MGKNPCGCAVCDTREAPLLIWKFFHGQRSLFSAELTLAQARGNEYQSLVQLYRSPGGGWQP